MRNLHFPFPALRNESTAVPLGLVAVIWPRQFKPVLQAVLSADAHNRGLDGLGFVKDAYRRITDISHLDFRVAARFTGRMPCFCIKPSPMPFEH
jgi:hypothetical protein